ncbi:C-C motif chemokine 4-like [Boleophthalmus pectinirostris]|uniref:C-C motif chemokine 4-like n=1 Tax=Boleophthalmus pectinirostris TaxID=150288 RepID=UPI00243151E1|nr:C-C motif chemokine 4-like [Boleophthalmus pectinirostris]
MANLSVCATMMMVILMLGESSSSKCCTTYDPIRPPRKALIYYIVQDITELCHIRAIIFQTVVPKKQGMGTKLLCANPVSDWVIRAMETVPHYDQWKKKII